MYNYTQSKIRIVIGIFIALFILLIALYAASYLSRIGKVPVDIETAPEDISIKINEKKAHTGTNYLKEGTYTITAEKSGYETTSQTVNITKQNNYIALIPNPVSEEAIKEANSPKVSSRAQTISGIASETSGAALQGDNPIVKKLPYIDISGPFKIDYGYNQDNQSELYLLVSYTTPDSRQKAIKWLKGNGVNLTTREIIFSDFSNPAIRGDSHD